MANKVINKEDFLSNTWLKEYKGTQPVSSTMFEKIFLPMNRVPKALVNQFVQDPEAAEKMMTAQIPIFQTFLEKAYWSDESRGFDRIDVDIYGAVCLADDRHLLDSIIAHGKLIQKADKYTLRQASMGLGLKDVAWEYFLNQDAIDQPLSNRGVYFHVPYKDLCEAMGVRNLKKTRQQINVRLHRLSIMRLLLTPSLNGEALTKSSFPISLIDKDFYSLLDKSKIRNNKFDEETHTDLIVNVSSYYTKTLKKDGGVTRERLHGAYPDLVGKNSIEDFYKFIDSNKRSYIHGKYISDLIIRYFDNKMGLFGVNKTYKQRQVFEQLINDRDNWLRHYKMILKEVNRKNPLSKSGIDYVLQHLPTMEKKGT